MRPDDQKRKATQKSGAKDASRLQQQHQPQSAANRDRADRSHHEAGPGKVRSQDPNFGRGHH